MIAASRPLRARRSRAPSCTAGGLLLAVLLTAVGCEVPEGAREHGAPRLRVEAPFASGDAGARASADAAPAPESRAEALQRQMRRRSAQPADGAAPVETVSIQRISLGNGMVGDLPHAASGWRWARDGDVTLAVRDRGDGADALIYVQSLTAASRRRPAMDTYRFQLAVDRELATAPMKLGSDLWPAATPAAGVLPLSSTRLLSALEMLRTPTLGRGLGYRSEPDSFTGWRWIGSNRQQTLLRLARTRGTWGDPLPLAEEVELLLEVLSEEAPELGDLLWQAPSFPGTPGPAWMILGSASRDDGRGLHLALLCRVEPDCVASRDLGLFLHSLRPVGTGDRVGSIGDARDDLDDLAREHGLALYTGRSAPDAATLTAALSKAVEARRPVTPERGRPADPGPGSPTPSAPTRDATSDATSTVTEESHDAQS